jgi:hypothetical protein
MFKSLELLKNEYNTFTVAKISTTSGHVTHLYEYIKNIEEAYILAQYAMNAHRCDSRFSDELIVILPGTNLGLKDTKDDAYLQSLLETYTSEDSES